MATKIRLTRKGKKNNPIYNIVVADERAPRDGKFIKKLGIYNPHFSDISKKVELDESETFKYLMFGAQPTTTVRNILSKEGLMYKLHLQKGVIKGAITQKQADTKLEKWKKEKETKLAKLSAKQKKEQEKNNIKNIKETVEIKEKKSVESEKTKEDKKSTKEVSNEETKSTDTINNTQTSVEVEQKSEAKTEKKVIETEVKDKDSANKEQTTSQVDNTKPAESKKDLANEKVGEAETIIASQNKDQQEPSTNVGQNSIAEDTTKEDKK